MPGRERFPRDERLARKRDFLRVYTTGGKAVERAFICYVARKEGQGRKVGFVVSRKVGNAVARNRIRRYLREVYRRHRKDFVEDFHMVVVALPSSAKLTYHQCETAMRHLFREGDVLRG